MAKITNKLRRRQLDISLKSTSFPEIPQDGYIREVRGALEMSTSDLAERMGVRQPTVMNMEANERTGSITLRSLERAAEALGCKLVYAFVPKTTLEDMVQEQAYNRAKSLSDPVFRTMSLEQQGTSEIEQNDLIAELASDIIRKGKRELWK